MDLGENLAPLQTPLEKIPILSVDITAIRSSNPYQLNFSEELNIITISTSQI